MIIHNFDPVLIDLGIFQIRWYSVAYILGIVLGWMCANKIIKLNFERVLFVASVNENKIMAMTPISTALNTNKKLRSLYIFLPL